MLVGGKKRLAGSFQCCQKWHTNDHRKCTVLAWQLIRCRRRAILSSSGQIDCWMWGLGSWQVSFVPLQGKYFQLIMITTTKLFSGGTKSRRWHIPCSSDSIMRASRQNTNAYPTYTPGTSCKNICHALGNRFQVSFSWTVFSNVIDHCPKNAKCIFPWVVTKQLKRLVQKQLLTGQTISVFFSLFFTPDFQVGKTWTGSPASCVSPRSVTTIVVFSTRCYVSEENY